MTRIFNDPLWQKERLARVDRQEIDAAKREAMRATREGFSIVKPGRWKVTRQNGAAVVEVF